MEEEKVDDISYEDRPYYVEENNLRRTSRENSGTGVELLKPSMEGKSYNSVIKQIKFLMKNDKYEEKQI